MNALSFPSDFLFGAATSAYQIEGAHDADGKGPSIWDQFVQQPGRIADGTTGQTACDHYRRYREDVALMAQLNLQAYRFSIAWPRVMPEGEGRINERGLDFYSRLVDELLEQNIIPFATLYHWDLPAALERRGGWTQRDTAARFADFAYQLGRRLADRVTHWITLNEPLASAAMGYLYGLHAPGHDAQLRNFLRASHNLNRAHGAACSALRAVDKDLVIGAAHVTSSIYPASSRTPRFVVDIAHQFVNELFLMPQLRGEYPSFVGRLMRYLNPDFRSEDLAEIGPSLDFVGVNNYTRRVARFAPNPLLPFSFVPPDPATARTTDMGWEIFPRGIYDILKWLQDDFDNPTVYITENGAEFEDEPSKDG
ncbi:MAG: family 1 glycosylhydrolase, partial [Polyangiaceae bacterium]